ncbi:DUF7873 family protein [Streptomyces malaysiensis]
MSFERGPSALIRRLPTLDAAESWSLDPSADCWKTGAVRTVRTKKVLSLWVGSNACGRVPVPVGSSVREGE